METCERVRKQRGVRSLLHCRSITPSPSLLPWLLRDTGARTPSEPSGAAVCRTSDRHTHCLSLRTCFACCFPCFLLGFFLLPTFSCHFSLFLLTHTHKALLIFHLALSVFSPSRFSLFLSCINSNRLPWKSGWGEGVSFQYHCFETNLLGFVMDNEMLAEWCRSMSLTSLKYKKAEAIFRRSVENWSFC